VASYFIVISQRRVDYLRGAVLICVRINVGCFAVRFVSRRVVGSPIAYEATMTSAVPGSQVHSRAVIATIAAISCSSRVCRNARPGRRRLVMESVTRPCRLAHTTSVTVSV